MVMLLMMMMKSLLPAKANDGDEKDAAATNFGRCLICFQTVVVAFFEVKRFKSLKDLQIVVDVMAVISVVVVVAVRG